MLDNEVKPFRLPMTRYEKHYLWLAQLLDCYAMIDFSVAEAIKQSERSLACHKGCAVCCHHTIPLSTLEVIGIIFYVKTVLDKDSRTLLTKMFMEQRAICLFNVGGSCLIYPFRPIACRRYMVSSKPCKTNENATITRPNDVLVPSRELFYKAIALTIPFYHSQNIYQQENENILDFYKRNNVKLSSVYDKILGI